MEKEERQEQYTEGIDCVTLIKEIQQKVFTVLTSYGQGSGFLYKKGGYVITYANGNYYVDMNETFDFYSGTGDYEYYERYKTYTVIIDEYGAFKIADIHIH